MCMFGLEKVIGSCYGLVTFLEILQRNGYDLHVPLKAECLSVNFSNATISSDVSLQMYASPQCLTSGGSVQYDCH